MRSTVLADPAPRVCADVLVTGFFEDVRPPQGMAGQVDWLAGGKLSRLIVHRNVSGRLGETALLSVPTFSTPRVLCVGLGRSSDYSYLVLHQVAEGLRPVLHALQVKVAAVELFGAQAGHLDPVIAARTILKAWYQEPLHEGFEVTFMAPKGHQPQQIEQRLREMGV
ncbi:MAG: M17 family peptidase N-terminal domain-containing protein [Nitrospirota bacterium]